MLTMQRKLLTQGQTRYDGGCPTAIEFGDDDSNVVFVMPVREWSDMGGPTEVTLTVQPGDLLNEPE